MFSPGNVSPLCALHFSLVLRTMCWMGTADTGNFIWDDEEEGGQKGVGHVESEARGPKVRARGSSLAAMLAWVSLPQRGQLPSQPQLS